jgi:hypothetical protein
MTSSIHDLKKYIFYEMLNLAGRVFILVKHSDDVVIGKRGFLPEEMEKGLVLVFNSMMNFRWDDAGISAKLVFGAATEQCFIPHDAVLSIFSPELSAQFTVAPGADNAAEKKRQAVGDAPKKTEKGKVVQVDFNKKR